MGVVWAQEPIAPKGQGGKSGKEEKRDEKALEPSAELFRFFPRPTPAVEARIRLLLGRLDHPDWLVRTRAVRELVSIGDPSIPYLETALGTSRSREARYRMRLVLHRLHWIPTSLLESVVRQNIEYLRKVRNIDALGEVKARILEQGARLLPYLEDHLKSKDWQVRRDIVLLLGAIGLRHRERRVVPLLIACLDDSSDLVKIEAGECLRRISGRSWKSYHRLEWKAWWKEHGKSFAFPKKDAEKEK